MLVVQSSMVPQWCLLDFVQSIAKQGVNSTQATDAHKVLQSVYRNENLGNVDIVMVSTKRELDIEISKAHEDLFHQQKLLRVILDQSDTSCHVVIPEGKRVVVDNNSISLSFTDLLPRYHVTDLLIAKNTLEQDKVREFMAIVPEGRFIKLILDVEPKDLIISHNKLKLEAGYKIVTTANNIFLYLPDGKFKAFK